MAVRKIRGHWWVDFHFDGQRRRWKSPVDNKRGAELYEHQLREKLLTGQSVDGEPEPEEVPTFKQFATDWLATYPTLKENRASEVRSKEQIVRVHLMPAFGQLRLDEITKEAIDKFAAGARKAGHKKTKEPRALKPKTVHNILQVLAKVLRTAEEYGKIVKRPHIQKPKVPQPRFDWLKVEESPALLKAARDEADRLMLTFALDTGARAGEQIALRWGDIDFHGRKVVFRASSTRGIEGPTKSGRVREVPLTSRLEAALKAHRHLRGDLVFCREDGAPLTLWQLHEVLWRTCRRAGLRRVRWHDLRHTFASQLVAAGVPLRQVQAWLGHSTITMVLRYSHLAPGENAHLIQVLERPGTGVQLGHQLGTGTAKLS